MTLKVNDTESVEHHLKCPTGKSREIFRGVAFRYRSRLTASPTLRTAPTTEVLALPSDEVTDVLVRLNTPDRNPSSTR